MKASILQKDVVIIGAGPSGLFAVFECGMLGLKCAVFDSLAEIGGQCTALYPEKPIYDIPGFPSVLAGDLIAQLEAQAAPFAPDYYTGQQIVSLGQESGLWRVISSRGTEVECHAIIVAAGPGAFGPNRPPLPDIEKYEGSGVFYMVRRKEDFRGKRIVVAGGGDSAVDWALALAPIAEKLYIVHRRDKFRAAPESIRLMEDLKDKGQIETIVPYQLHELKGKDGRLTDVVVSTMDGEQRILQADTLLPFFGLAAELGPLADWGFALDHKHILVDPATCQTDIDGIYAIGDIAAYKNKLKLILTGFNEGALAAHAIHRQIFPDRDLHFEYSTTKGLPGAA